MALALFGPASSLGVSPRVVAMTGPLSMNLWVYPRQNMLYKTAYLASGERGFTHARARALALPYPAFVLLPIVVSIVLAFRGAVIFLLIPRAIPGTQPFER